MFSISKSVESESRFEFTLWITKLGKYTYLLLNDYKAQRKEGIKAPIFSKSKKKELDTPDIECW